MKITIETIAHEDQRYPTVGDWFDSKAGDLEIKVSDMGNDYYAFLVALHEMIEAFLCKADGVTEQQVDEFDMAYEANRKEGDFSEPGNDPNCPCYHQHFFATAIEMLVAQKLGVDWPTYDDIVNKLD